MAKILAKYWTPSTPGCWFECRAIADMRARVIRIAMAHNHIEHLTSGKIASLSQERDRRCCVRHPVDAQVRSPEGIEFVQEGLF